MANVDDALLQTVLPKLNGLGYVVRFDAGEDGAITIDARDAAVAVADGSMDADTTIVATRENLEKLISGEMDPMLAYTLGRIKVQGSMGVAMKLVKAIG